MKSLFYVVAVAGLYDYDFLIGLTALIGEDVYGFLVGLLIGEFLACAEVAAFLRGLPLLDSMFLPEKSSIKEVAKWVN